MRLNDLARRMNDIPFKPFKIHLSDGSSISVRDSGNVILGRSSAVIPTEFEKDEDGFKFARHWRTVAFSHMVQFSDLDEPVTGKQPKRRR